MPVAQPFQAALLCRAGYISTAMYGQCNIAGQCSKLMKYAVRSNALWKLRASATPAHAGHSARKQRCEDCASAYRFDFLGREFQKRSFFFPCAYTPRSAAGGCRTLRAGPTTHMRKDDPGDVGCQTGAFILHLRARNQMRYQHRAHSLLCTDSGTCLARFESNLTIRMLSSAALFAFHSDAPLVQQPPCPLQRHCDALQDLSGPAVRRLTSSASSHLHALAPCRALF